MSNQELAGKLSGLADRRVCFISPPANPLLVPTYGGGWSGGAEAQCVTNGRSLSCAVPDVYFIVGDFGQPAQGEIGGVTVIVRHAVIWGQ